MKIKCRQRKTFALIAVLVSFVICGLIIYFLLKKNSDTVNFEGLLNFHLTFFIILGGIASVTSFILLTVFSFNFKNKVSKMAKGLRRTTQDMHHIRTIVNLMVQSNLWPSGMKEYMGKEYRNLSFFDVKEFHNGQSKMAIDFLRETHHFGETENIYLEMKAVLMTNPKEKAISDTLDYPVYYSPEIIRKWMEHKCGTGLWYVFGYKYGRYKEVLDLNGVYEHHQEKIMALARTLDQERFSNSSFNEVFLAKFWDYVGNESIPNLYRLQGGSKRDGSWFLYYLYSCFLLFSIFGIVIPSLHILFKFNAWVLISCYSIIISTIFFMAISFFLFLSRKTTQ